MPWNPYTYTLIILHIHLPFFLNVHIDVCLLQIEIINKFDKDKEKLGDAEKFYCLLLSLPAYRLRIEGMLLKLCLPTIVDTLRTNIKAVQTGCVALLENKSLKEFLRYVLHTGNFINAVSVLNV